MNKEKLELVLGRPEYTTFIEQTELEVIDFYKRNKVLIFGANGSIGTAVTKFFINNNLEHWATDIDTVDIRDQMSVWKGIKNYEPNIILNLAGAKHAPAGEEDPVNAFYTNTLGAYHVLLEAQQYGAKVLTASTCKACNPETAYGASKLIAERMTLNEGGWVARFYNVIETSGNVFEIWEQLPESEDIEYTHCLRYFISLDEAKTLTLLAPTFKSGRYTIEPSDQRSMHGIAFALYPDRNKMSIRPRRGDRFEEPLRGTNETMFPVEYFEEIPIIWKIESDND